MIPIIKAVSDAERELAAREPGKGWTRPCRGKRGLCGHISKWKVTHRKRVGYITHWWCDDCLPEQYRVRLPL